jgi:hypothetical protein
MKCPKCKSKNLVIYRGLSVYLCCEKCNIRLRVVDMMIFEKTIARFTHFTMPLIQRTFPELLLSDITGN